MMEYIVFESEYMSQLNNRINSYAQYGWLCKNISVSEYMAGYNHHVKYVVLMERERYASNETTSNN